MADAICRYATDPTERRHFLNLHWRAHIRSGAEEDLLTLEEATEYEALRVFLEDELIRKLIRGELVAHWHPAGCEEPRAIAATWWIGARVDSRKGEAFSSGTLVANPQIKLVTVGQSQPRPLPQPGPKTDHHQEMRTALSDLLASRTAPFASAKEAHTATMGRLGHAQPDGATVTTRSARCVQTSSRRRADRKHDAAAYGNPRIR